MSDQDQPTAPQTLVEKRALLARLLARESQRTKVFPLSYAQKRIWLLNQIGNTSHAYNMSSGVRLSGTVEITFLQQSLNQLVERHDILRTTFKSVDGQPVQEVRSGFEVDITVVDVSAGPEREDPETAMNNHVRQEMQRPFDLENGPLFRLFLLRMSSHEQVLLLTMHHIISDGWSLGLFFKELGQLYDAFKDGRPSPLAPLQEQYADFIAWQTRRFGDEHLQPQFEYWRKQLKNTPSLLQLPIDRPRPGIQTFAGTRQPVSFSQSITRHIKQLSQQQGLTLFMTLLAAFNVLLYRYTAQEDIVVGSPIAGRNRKEDENMIGFFVNTLTLRSDLSGNPTFIDLMQRVREVALGAYKNQDLPFEKLVEEVLVDRSLSHNPLFQTAFALQNIPAPLLEISDAEATPLEIQWQTSKVDLSLMLQETGHGLEGFIEYNTDLFDQATVKAFGEHYAELLNSIVSNPRCPISRLRILPKQERHKLIYAWNRTSRQFPDDICFHQLFERQAENRPDAIAVTFNRQQLTYSELDRRANRLARYLRSLGVGANFLVAVSMERSLDMIVAVLGIMKAGGAYVPLDPGYPRERLIYMLEDSQANILLTQTGLLNDLGEHVAHAVCLDDEWETIEQEAASEPGVMVSLDDLAYVIYTSGSTGKPKAVMVPHRGISNLSHEQTRLFDVGPDSRVLQFSSLSFDASVFEIVMALTHGAVLCMGDRDSISVGQNLFDFLIEHRITIVTLPPSALLNLPPGDLPELRTITVAGEACPESLVSKWARGRQFFNLYGPTEATIWSTYEECRDQARPPTIGRPISNVKAYILDPELEPVPTGVAGELHIGGKSVTRGYLNRPELTRAKFIPDPFSDSEGEIVYKTGDLARYRKDGNIEFLGRIDHQVKIRGFRVELGEIESVLNRHPAVAENCVVAWDDNQDKRLVAYVVLKQSASWDELKAHLRERLLEHMVPAVFVKLDRLPVNQSGKVARNELPIPTLDRQVNQDFVAASNEVEEELARIWQELLHLDSVGIRDNFFDLGGHSLLAVQMHARIKEKFTTPISIVDLFQYPTIETLSRRLQLSGGESAASLSRDGEQKPQNRNIHTAEPIAIIGMSGRYPDAKNTAELWLNLEQGKESLTIFTDDELRASGVDEDLLKDPDYVKAGVVLDDIDLFDASFFGFTPREAQITDPQQRIFLECAWETMESAGYVSSKCDSVIGVFAGVSQNRYLWGMMNDAELLESTSEYQMHLVNDKDFLPTRISYKLNLSGPSVNVQTACSTSLASIHMACQSLQRYECDMVLSGGVSIGVPQKVGYLYQPDNIRSPDGHCRAFDANAAGCVRGYGASVVLLKRLDEALADGDTIYAVIKGSAINNDGSNKVGFTAPSVQGQAEVIRRAQEIAGVEPESITYIETHGTGTAIGDPIEIAGLTSAFRSRTTKKQYCAIGSVKTNLGHLDAAAGATSLIKTSLAIQHRVLPPSLNFEAANPEIDFENSPFFVNTELQPWISSSDLPLRAGVSSFGIGGTNVHAVLEEPPQRSASGPSRDWKLVLLSAKSESALGALTSNLSKNFEENSEVCLADAAYTLMLGREDFEYRRAFLCRDAADLLESIAGIDAGKVWTGTPIAGDPEIVFMFTGQGSQYPGMAAELYRSEAVFREQVDSCCEYLKSHLDLDLRGLLFPQDDCVEWAADQLQNTRYAQPALFVIECSLARLWMSWGITPGAMIGHSIGEYVAAYLASVFSLEDALALVATRARLMSELPRGSMLAVPLSSEELAPMLYDELSLAAINGPELSIVSGPEEAVGLLAEDLEAKGMAPRRLHTSHAFHSSMMDPVIPEFVEAVEKVALNAPKLRYLSNVTGTWISAADVQNPSYWGRHLRNSVCFSAGLEELFKRDNRIYLEVGPGRTLSSLVKNHPAKPADLQVCASIPSIQEKLSGEAFILENLAKLWLAGVCPDWAGFHTDEARYRIPLPTYPFERQRYWAGPTGLFKSVTRAQVSGLENWFYIPSWKRSILTTGWLREEESRPTENWLIFNDSAGLGERISSRLRKLGQGVTTVSVGNAFRRRDANHFELRPDQCSEYRQLLDQLHADNEIPGQVIHLWSADVDTAPESEAKALDARLKSGFFSLLYLVQAMESLGDEIPWELTAVTSQSQAVVAGESLSPGKATLMGVVKAMCLEKPQLRARCIDLTCAELSLRTSSLETSVLNEIAARDEAPLVALRGNQRWVPSFEPLPLKKSVSSPHRLRHGGVYLITGGLGRLGLTLAKYLATAAGARIILVGRSELPQESEWEDLVKDPRADDNLRWKISRLQALRARGTDLMICKADVANAQDMREVFARAEARYGQINGVLHAAGEQKNGEFLDEATFDACQRQFNPKIQGLLVLDEVLADRNIDFCLLCSSLASVLGVSGFVSYIASHLFMDAYANARNLSGGTPWICVDWDNWNLKDDLSGLSPGLASFTMSPGEGCDALGRILDVDSLRHVVVSTGDLHSRIEQWARPGDDATETPNAAVPAATDDLSPFSDNYLAPRNPAEQILVDIWQKMLGIKGIGVLDNFFELGGDSVLNIQITARARKAGLLLKPGDVFEYQTIGELAAVTQGDNTPVAEQSLVTGPLPATPIMQWFLEQEWANPNHFNQARMLSLSRPLGFDLLEQALNALLTQHDALRLRYLQSGSDKGFSIAGAEAVSLLRVDLSDSDEADLTARLEEEATRLQTSLDITSGPIFKAAYFDLGERLPPRICIVIHHLAIDAVSWRLLLEDLETACLQLDAGKVVSLPEKSSSIRTWSEAVETYAQSRRLEKELGHWAGLARNAAIRLPLDYQRGDNTAGSSDRVSGTLDPDQTRVLLRQTSGTSVNRVMGLLLTALAKSIARWSAQTTIFIDLEGHGRDISLVDEVDISRTVGWFTTLYPACFKIDPDMDASAAIESVENQYGNIPAGGSGYGILKYLAHSQKIRQELDKINTPEIMFLYFGRIDDSSVPGTGLFTPAPESVGPVRDAANERQHKLEINAGIVNGCLEMNWTYSRNLHRRKTIEDIAQDCLQALLLLIDAADDDASTGFSVEDFSARNLKQTDLKKILQRL